MPVYDPETLVAYAKHLEEEIERLRTALSKCQWRLFGAGLSTDELYAELRDLGIKSIHEQTTRDTGYQRELTPEERRHEEWRSARPKR